MIRNVWNACPRWLLIAICAVGFPAWAPLVLVGLLIALFLDTVANIVDAITRELNKSEDTQ